MCLWWWTFTHSSIIVSNPQSLTIVPVLQHYHVRLSPSPYFNNFQNRVTQLRQLFKYHTGGHITIIVIMRREAFIIWLPAREWLEIMSLQNAGRSKQVFSPRRRPSRCVNINIAVVNHMHEPAWLRRIDPEDVSHFKKKDSVTAFIIKFRFSFIFAVTILVHFKVWNYETSPASISNKILRQPAPEHKSRVIAFSDSKIAILAIKIAAVIFFSWLQNL